MIDMNTIRQVLGSAFKEDGDYLVCGYDQLHVCEVKGYLQVGEVQDPSPGDQKLLIFDRGPALRVHAAADAQIRAQIQAEKQAREAARIAAQEAKPSLVERVQRLGRKR